MLLYSTSQEYTHDSRFVVFCCQTIIHKSFQCCFTGTGPRSNHTQGYFTGTGAIVGLPQWQCNNPGEYRFTDHMKTQRTDNISTKRSIVKPCAYSTGYTSAHDTVTVSHMVVNKRQVINNRHTHYIIILLYYCVKYTLTTINPLGPNDSICCEWFRFPLVQLSDPKLNSFFC